MECTDRFNKDLAWVNRTGKGHAAEQKHIKCTLNKCFEREREATRSPKTSASMHSE